MAGLSKTNMVGRPGTTRSGTTSASSQSFTAVSANVYIIRIAVNQATRISYNTAATASSMLIPTGSQEYFSAIPGDVIHYIQDSAAGAITMTEIS